MSYIRTNSREQGELFPISLDEMIQADRSSSADSDIVRMTDEEMVAKARTSYFVRDPEANVVYCPQGKKLRTGCVDDRASTIRYWNRKACDLRRAMNISGIERLMGDHVGRPYRRSCRFQAQLRFRNRGNQFFLPYFP